ncbi:MAG: hypothetical protein ACRDF4_07170 [Rhabdochlamydiaceae bacterium]
MSVSEMERGQELQEKAQTLLEEGEEERQVKSGQSRRNPPARNTSRFWFERFLSVIQRQNPSTIDATFLSQIAPSNEGKLLAQLKFLHVIDDQGKPTRLLPMLNMVGDEHKKAFQEIARGSYQDLFTELKLERAVPDDLINFFIRKHVFTRDKAINAAKFFLYLAEKGSVLVSSELGGLLSEKVSNGQNAGASGQQLSDKVIARSPPREQRSITTQARQQMLQKRKDSRAPAEEVERDESTAEPSIRATITITLDKDTPKEYWDRVLALLGEKSASESHTTIENGPRDLEENNRESETNS